MNNLKKIRLKNKLTIVKISQYTNLAPGYIANLENGVKTNPSKVVMDKLATALNTTVYDLFYKKDGDSNG